MRRLPCQCANSQGTLDFAGDADLQVPLHNADTFPIKQALMVP